VKRKSGGGGGGGKRRKSFEMFVLEKYQPVV